MKLIPIVTTLVASSMGMRRGTKIYVSQEDSTTDGEENLYATMDAATFTPIPIAASLEKVDPSTAYILPFQDFFVFVSKFTRQNRELNQFARYDPNTQSISRPDFLRGLPLEYTAVQTVKNHSKLFSIHVGMNQMQLRSFNGRSQWTMEKSKGFRPSGDLKSAKSGVIKDSDNIEWVVMMTKNSVFEEEQLHCSKINPQPVRRLILGK